MPILSESHTRQATPRDKAYKIYDSGGLHLKVSTTGARLWRFKYHFGRAEQHLVIGKYPDIPLTRAREKRDAARRLLADGIDPAIHIQAVQVAVARSQGKKCSDGVCAKLRVRVGRLAASEAFRPLVNVGIRAS